MRLRSGTGSGRSSISPICTDVLHLCGSICTVTSIGSQLNFHRIGHDALRRCAREWRMANNEQRQAPPASPLFTNAPGSLPQVGRVWGESAASDIGHLRLELPVLRVSSSAGPSPSPPILHRTIGPVLIDLPSPGNLFQLPASSSTLPVYRIRYVCPRACSIGKCDHICVGSDGDDIMVQNKSARVAVYTISVHNKTESNRRKACCY